MVNKYLKKVDEKTVLFAVFILLAILALGSLLVINKPKLTGHAIIEGYNETECIEAGYTWQNVTEEDCTDRDICLADCPECGEVVIGGECENLTYVIRENCEAANYTWQNVTEEDCTDRDICLADCPECGEVVTGQECVGDICGDGGIQNPNDDGVAEVCDDGAENGIECSPDYGASCQYCSDTCELITLEGSYCGDDTCDVAENCDSCDADCACDSGSSCVDGDCESDDDTSSDDSSADVTGAIIDGMKKSSCVSNWECSEWTPCTAGMQTRECTDSNNCVTPTDEPAVSLSCVGSPKTETPKTSETCSDGIRNQDEKGIDCGGVCEQRCSFFTIMGNVVNVPVNSSKQFIKNNKAISFSILGLIVLAVGWIVCVKVFLKKKNIFFFLENFDFSKCLAFFKGKKTD